MKLIKFIVGILLLPACVAISKTLWTLVISIHPESDWLLPTPAIALLAGLLLWLLLYYTLPRPVRSYILAHELTHALWGALMGASIHSIDVKQDHGSVTLSKNNFIITLAPYFFPLYTSMTLLLYYGLAVFYDVVKYDTFWLGAIGLTWGFHLTFTISALMQHQTDIQEHGALFSYAIIYLFNVLGICTWVVMVSPATLETLVTLLHSNTETAALLAYRYLQNGITTLKNIQ